jgi:hypothetical protein
MKAFPLMLLFSSFLLPALFAQQIPVGYILQYQQNFSAGKSLGDFQFTTIRNWGLQASKGNYYLQLSDENPADGIPSPPQNLAVLKNHVFGDFILEADIMPYADLTGFKEACLFLGLKDTTKYYYIHLPADIDSIRPAIYVFKNGSVKRLTEIDIPSLAWKEDKWHKVRIERNIVSRTIRVFVDNMSIPVMYIKDYELVMGSIGFGSAKCGARFDNISIWAPTVIHEEL